MDLLIAHGIGIGSVLDLFFLLMLSLLSLTIPMASLVGVLIGLGRLTMDKEMLALRINGINLFRAFSPVIAVATLFTCIMIVSNFTVMPKLMLRITDLVYNLEFKLLTSLEPNRFYDNIETGDMDLSLYFADKTKDQTLKELQLKVSQSVYIPQTDENGEVTYIKKKRQILIMAKEGKIIPGEKERILRIYLTNGSIIPLTEHDSKENTIIHFEELHRTLTPELSGFKGGEYQKRPREMTLDEMQAQMDAYRERGRDKDLKRLREIQKELFQRLSIPMACVAFVLLGIPLALIIRPSGKSAGFALSFALLFLYFVMLKWGSTLIEERSGSFWIAIFLPNIILGAIGSILMYFEIRK